MFHNYVDAIWGLWPDGYLGKKRRMYVNFTVYLQICQSAAYIYISTNN